MGGTKNAYRILVRKREGQRQLGIPRRRWKDDNIKLSHTEMGHKTCIGLI
jgi:hypothetical protein